MLYSYIQNTKWVCMSVCMYVCMCVCEWMYGWMPAWKYVCNYGVFENFSETSSHQVH